MSATATVDRQQIAALSTKLIADLAAATKTWGPEIDVAWQQREVLAAVVGQFIARARHPVAEASGFIDDILYTILAAGRAQGSRDDR